MSDVSPEPAAPAETPAPEPAPEPVVEPAPAEVAPEPTPEPEPSPAPAPAADTTPEQAELDQLNGRIAVQDERIKELSGYQTEVRDQRDTVASLTAEIASLTAERDQAVKAASQAQAAATDAVSSQGAQETMVGHAKSLAAAIKGLLS